jgi:hypothetical protein
MLLKVTANSNVIPGLTRNPGDLDYLWIPGKNIPE